MAVIKVPSGDFSGKIGNVQFVDGQAETDDRAVIEYCQGAGYEVGGRVLNPGRTPEVPDPREATTATVGTRLRDAAVEPKDGDFLAPVNAGEENPHGPAVLSPGIHGERPGPVLPGPVPEDPAEQEERESVAAVAAVLGERDDSAGDTEEDPADPAGDPAPEVPAGNAGRDEWHAYALATGADPKDLEGKGRDQLRAEYGPKK